MGLFSNIGRGALGWSTGGLSELGRKDPFGLGGNRASVAPRPWTPLTAQNTMIPAGLEATLGGIGTNAYNRIGSNYEGARAKQGQEAATLQKPVSQYGVQRLSTAQNLDQGDLASVLGGELGSKSYENALQERDYGQNLTLADQIAALNRPSTLEEIFGGIGAIGKPVATYAGMRGTRKPSGYQMSRSDPGLPMEDYYSGF